MSDNLLQPSPSFPLLAESLLFSAGLRREAISSRICGVLNFLIGLFGLVISSLNYILLFIGLVMFVFSFFLRRLGKHLFTYTASLYFAVGIWNILVFMLSSGETVFLLILGIFQMGFVVHTLKLRKKHQKFLDETANTDAVEKAILAAAAYCCEKHPSESWEVRVSGKSRTMNYVDREMQLNDLVKAIALGQIPLDRAVFRAPSSENFAIMADQPKLKAVCAG